MNDASTELRHAMASGDLGRVAPVLEKLDDFRGALDTLAQRGDQW